MDASQIGKRAWSYAGVLQDAGLSCFEYVEQLTLLVFLKMADQLTEEPYNQPATIPDELSWKALLPQDGAALEDKYREILEKLALKGGMLGVILKSARCEIHNPELLKRDKLSLDMFWIKDKSLTDTDSLPAPEILAQELADDLETALEQFTKIAAKLSSRT